EVLLVLDHLAFNVKIVVVICIKDAKNWILMIVLDLTKIIHLVVIPLYLLIMTKRNLLHLLLLLIVVMNLHLLQVKKEVLLNNSVKKLLVQFEEKLEV